ncbi:MAG: class II glutamine amidotransferase [Rhodobacteraceae bacterium]|nr:class II glutamine amidotransferase [Paracoccaceae bacterium]
MCRWAAWIGAPVFLETIISDPEHSLIEQSHHAEHCKSTINADGFGVAWYDHRAEPGLYRDTYPAWSDPNLRAIAGQVRSPLFLAHVRASTGSATSRNNCHPFTVGRWSFMHNGQIGGFEAFRKRADMSIPDAYYGHRKGASDSEVLFLTALGHGLDRDPVAALSCAVGDLEAMSRAYGTGPHMRLSAAVSDGECLYAVRYASDQWAPSLYYRYCERARGWSVVSEPYEAADDWTAVPPGTICRFDGDTVAAAPFAPAARCRAAA